MSLISCPYCRGEFNAGKVRSTKHHRRFFAMIKATFDAWPETHAFQPKSAEELRKWLTAKAGYKHVIHISPPPELISEDPRLQRRAQVWMAQTVAAFRATHEHTWISHADGDIIVIIPQSLAFNEMSQSEFGDLSDAVKRVIWQQTNYDADELLEGSKCNTT